MRLKPTLLFVLQAGVVGLAAAFVLLLWRPELLNREPKFPYVLGTDGAGTVAQVGENIDRFKEGDRVYALELGNPKGGFYAEYAAVNGNNVSLIPGDLTMEQAAAMPSDALTALRGLDDILRLQRDESVMIFGASGGIGHLAVQLAKRLGVRVFAVASGQDGVSFVKRLGADAAADGRGDDVLKLAREFAPNGIDAALVTAGGGDTDRASNVRSFDPESIRTNFYVKIVLW